MAEPGDPKEPQTPHHDVDHDDAIGFASPSSLQGRPIRPPEPEPEPFTETEPVVTVPEQAPALFDPPEPEPEPLVVAEPEAEPPVEPEPVIAAPPTPKPAPAPKQAPQPTPAWAVETPPETPPPARPQTQSQFRSASGAKIQPRTEVEGASSLFTVYALILFAVPTLGVSAAIALVAILSRQTPRDSVAASHFVYQQRTLWAGAVVALLGAILIAVGLGVFVLFVLAVWLILRGAAGVLKLKAGRPIPNPRAWLI